MSNLQSGTIGRKCSKCEITVADKRAVQYFRCGHYNSDIESLSSFDFEDTTYLIELWSDKFEPN